MSSKNAATKFKVESTSANTGFTRVVEQTVAAALLRQPQVYLSLFFSIRAIPVAAVCCEMGG